MHACTLTTRTASKHIIYTHTPHATSVKKNAKTRQMYNAAALYICLVFAFFLTLVACGVCVYMMCLLAVRVVSVHACMCTYARALYFLYKNNLDSLS